ncbi:uncharacterized protein TNCV_1296101 [Trichonephila clavipes]|uniref:Uncharacterized protein n=1 Tax=Trichonephila clavipes TaxID=2585209 RepID=A0A8X6SHS7_TRICX|nr:uncharacterized protein TNCV_1296101 [Trichonephila clavipes]
MKCPIVQRSSERRNVSLVGLMQYLNFGTKYEAAEITVDILRLSNKICLIRQVKIIVTRKSSSEDESLSNSSSLEEILETLEEKSSTLNEKLEKKSIQAQGPILFYYKEFLLGQDNEGEKNVVISHIKCYKTG